jgi:Icc-related predicted phosphoesterase
VRIFYATDLHGSEVCWRKFLNAGTFHRADVLILGGDMTGKALVPIVDRGDGTHETTLQERHEILTSEEAIREIEKRIVNRGYYPIRVTREEYRAMQADPALVDARFREAMLSTVERWMDIAQEKLAGRDLPAFVCPGNDDIFEVDDVIARSQVVQMGEARTLDVGEGFRMVSMGWTNPTPWHTYREAPEDDLRKRIDDMLETAPDYRRTIFNFHAPPYGSNLDEAPALDDDLRYVSGGRALRPVGSRAVRDAIVDYQPLLSLHGHIHESKGGVRIGKTLAVNPGSAYEEGVLQAGLIELDSKKGTIKNYVLING